MFMMRLWFNLFVLSDDIYLFSEVSLPNISTTHGTPQTLCRPLPSASSVSTTPNPWWTTLKRAASTSRGWSRSTNSFHATEDLARISLSSFSKQLPYWPEYKTTLIIRRPPPPPHVHFGKRLFENQIFILFFLSL